MREYRKTKPKGPGVSVLMKAMTLATILKDNCPDGGKVDPEKVDKFVEEVKNPHQKRLNTLSQCYLV